LRQSIFDPAILYDKGILEAILEILEEGSKTLLVFNFLIFTDFSRWEQLLVKRLLDFMSAIVQTGELNLMYKCYNPILIICLCCEFLTKIGNAISFFKQEANNMSVELQRLGEKLIENMQEDFVATIFMDTDFLDRTVLNMITN
jgi:hypothetical protein